MIRFLKFIHEYVKKNVISMFDTLQLAREIFKWFNITKKIHNSPITNKPGNFQENDIWIN